jgi:hypothetical protein
MITLTEAITYEALTNAQLLALINSNGIKPAFNYLVTDASFTDGGVLVQGVTTKSVSSIGSGIFLNADYQGVGNYSAMTPAFNSFKGIWTNTPLAVAIGDVVVYNNRNFVNLTGVWGTSPDTDLVNWNILPKLNGYGYIQEIDEVTYDVNSNLYGSRKDKRGNSIQSSPTDMLTFQWGRDAVYRNTMVGNSKMIITNTQCQVYDNFLNSKSYIADNTSVATAGLIYRNNLSEESYIQSANTQGDIYYNTLFSESYINIITQLGAGRFISSNTLGATSYLDLDDIQGNITGNSMISGGSIIFSGIMAGGQITRNSLNGSSTMFLANLTNTQVNQNVINSVSLTINFGNNGGFTENNMSSQLQINSLTATLTQCNFALSGVPITINSVSVFTIAKSCRNGFSNFETTLDFATQYNPGNLTLTIPSNSDHIGIFKLSNTASVIVQRIANCPANFVVLFQPNNGQVVNFKHVDISVAINNELISDAGAFTNTLTGRTNGSDFIEYKRSGTLLVRNNIAVAVT